MTSIENAISEFDAAKSVWDQAGESLESIERRIHDGCVTHAELVSRADNYTRSVMRVRRTPVQDGEQMLEVGSGVGYMMQGMARRMDESGKRYHITGLDISSRMIDLGHERLKNDSRFGFLKYDGLHVPMPDNSMDFIYSVSAIQHIPKSHMYSLFFEIHRIMKPGSEAVFHFLPFTHIQLVGRDNWRQEVSRQIDKKVNEHWSIYYSPMELINVLVAGTGFMAAEILMNNYVRFAKKSVV